MAHVDHSAVCVEVVACPVGFGHISAAQTTKALHLNLVAANFFNHQARRVSRNLLAFADAPLFELAFGRTIELGICGFVAPSIVVDLALPVKLVLEDALLFLDCIAGFLQ
ncbi:hypothetical protein HG530_011048 [Fusarium avenaceum]|nr:hypothetical protein HG530_011048 [Fusarium avenaceum]